MVFSEELKEKILELFTKELWTARKIYKELGISKKATIRLLKEELGDDFEKAQHKGRSKAFSGENNPRFSAHVSKETREKISKGNLGKTHTEESKLKMSKTRKRKYKENPELGKLTAKPMIDYLTENGHPMKGKKHSKESVTNMRLAGELRRGIPKDPESVRKTAEAHRGMKRSKETRELQSKVRAEKFANGSLKLYTNNKRGHYVSKITGKTEYYHSSWELVRMEQLDELGYTWTKEHKVVIPYQVEGIAKSYVPDFYVETPDGIVIEEVKGWYNTSTKIKEKFAIDYCQKKGWQYMILLKEDLFK